LFKKTRVQNSLSIKGYASSATASISTLPL
jgi:hypothetical protein